MTTMGAGDKVKICLPEKPDTGADVCAPIRQFDEMTMAVTKMVIAKKGKNYAGIHYTLDEAIGPCDQPFWFMHEWLVRV